MKILLYFLAVAGLVFAQDQEPAKVTPGTPAVKGPAEVVQAPAASPPAPVAPDAVVIEVAGKKYTAAEVDQIIATLPPNNQAALHTQPGFLSQVFLFRRLMDDAIKNGIDQQTPYKQQLDASRMTFLAQTEMNYVNNSTKVTEDEERKYYNDNPDKFKEVKVRVIYIAFNPAPGKVPTNGRNYPTEAEAKAKMDDLAKQIAAGADFGKLARENSDDPSASKDGDFGSINSESTYPTAIKTAVLALKQGEVTPVIKQPAGFYLIRAEQTGLQPFNDVFGTIAQTVRQAKFDEYMKNLKAQYNVKVENPAYFAPRAPAQLQQVH
jgi:hypothetical protein